MLARFAVALAGGAVGYRSRDCRAGGAMDERLADAPWLAPARP